MSDWWSRKLTGNAPAAPTRTFNTPVSTPPIGIRQTTMAVTPLHSQSVAQQQVLDENRAATDQIGMSDAIRLWKGGEAHRRDGHGARHGLLCISHSSSVWPLSSSSSSAHSLFSGRYHASPSAPGPST